MTVDYVIDGDTIGATVEGRSERVRLLSYADIHETDVSHVMLDEGWADLYTGNPDLTRSSTYIEAVDERTRKQCAAITSK